jgi:MFS family permease
MITTEIRSRKLTIMAINFLLLATAFASVSTWSVAVPFIQTTFHLSATMVQLGTSVLIIGFAIGTFVQAQAAARIGLRNTGLFAIGSLLVAQLLIPVAPSYWLVLFLRFVQGWGIVLFIATNMTTPLFPISQRAMAAGVVAAGVPFGAGFGGLLAGALLSATTSWRTTFLVFDGLMLGVAILWLAVTKNADRPEQVGLAQPNDGNSAYRSLTGWLLALCVFCISFQFLGLYAVLPVYLYTLGYLPKQVGVALLIGGLSGALTAPLGGVISDSLIASGHDPLKSRFYVMTLAGFLIAAIGTILLPVITAAGFTALVVGIIVAGWNASASITGALPTELMPTPEAAGKLFGLIIVVGMPGAAISPYLAALIAGGAGWQSAFFLLGAVAIVGTVIGVAAPKLAQRAI